MDPSKYLSCLKPGELEIEFIVRGLNSRTTNSDVLLLQRLSAETSDNTLQPVKSHVTKNPEVETEGCRARAEEFLNFVNDFQESSELDEQAFDSNLARCIHWKNRIFRLKNSFGDLPNIIKVDTSLRRVLKTLLNFSIDHSGGAQSSLTSEPPTENTPNNSDPNSKNKDTNDSEASSEQNKSDKEDDSMKSTNHILSKEDSEKLKLVDRLVNLDYDKLNNLGKMLEKLTVDKDRKTVGFQQFGQPKTRQIESSADSSFRYPIKSSFVETRPSNVYRNVVQNTDRYSLHDGNNLNVEMLSQNIGNNFLPNIGVPQSQCNPLFSNLSYPPLPSNFSASAQCDPIPQHNPNLYNPGMGASSSQVPNLHVEQPQNQNNPWLAYDLKFKRRWNILFDGTGSMNVTDFIYRIQTMAIDDQYPLEKLPRVMHLYLSGKASNWFWVYKQSNPVATWVEMRDALRLYFSSYESEEETREQIVRRFQGAKESFADFSLEVQMLNGRLTNRLSDRELISRLCHNMHPALRNVTLAHQASIRSIEELRVLCQRFEKLWSQTGYDPKQSYDSQYRRKAQINEINFYGDQNLQTRSMSPDKTPQLLNNNCSCSHQQNYHRPSVNQITGSVRQGLIESNPTCVQSHFNQHGQSTVLCQTPNPSSPILISQDSYLHVDQNSDNHSIEAIHSQNTNTNNSSPSLICWNCKDLGHRYQDCEKEFQHVFCFGCGAPNIRKPNCLKCQSRLSGNFRSGVSYSRGPHPETMRQNPNFSNVPQ